ncbi:hypothetical protein BDR04DRAFT_937274, partial [Suillus decipiens]
NGHTIQPSKFHKFLGMIIDQDLNFKEHTSFAMAKGITYTMACNWMIKTTKGIHRQLMRRLYKGVVILKMLYAADVWCTGIIAKGKGKRGGGHRARGFTSQMARVQHMATIIITGGLHSLATTMLNSHANVLPIQQIVCK